MKLKITYLSLTKCMFFCMLLYSCFVLPLLNNRIPRMTVYLGLLMIVFLVLHLNENSFDIYRLLLQPVKLLLVFAVISAISVLVTRYGFDMSGILELTESIVLMMTTIYIIKMDGNIDFVLKSFIVVILLGALLSIKNVTVMDRLSLSDKINCNEFAHSIVCAMVCLAFFVKKGLKFRNTMIFLTEAVMLIVIVLTGSRLSLICAVAFILMYFLYITPEIGSHEFSEIIVKLLFSVIAIALVAAVAFPFFSGTLMAERMGGLFEVFAGNDGDGIGRVELYKTAYGHFIEHPFFGVGYGFFGKIHGGVYTHSTYAELISCTGMFGTIVFMLVYASLYKPLKDLLNQTREDRYKVKLLIVMFFVLLIMGVGEILYYKIVYFVIFGVLAAYPNISKEYRCI